MEVLENVEGSKAAKTRQPVAERELGRSSFPVARVQKILKADKELAGIAKEAVFLVSLATEKFIARVAEAARSQAGRERRTTVQKKDILMVIRREEEYFFLGDILKETPVAKGILQALKAGETKMAGTGPGNDDSPEDDAQSFGGTNKKNTDQEVDSDEERLAGEGEDGRSEGVSLPPSSRPSTPLSLGDGDSGHFEPLEDEMEEDR